MATEEEKLKAERATLKERLAVVDRLLEGKTLVIKRAEYDAMPMAERQKIDFKTTVVVD